MQEAPRRTLAELIRRLGPELGNDPGRLDGLLRDYVGMYRREIAVLVTAAREGIPRQLQDRQINLPRELRRARLVQQLEDNVAMSAEAARWAVEAWAEALGQEPVHHADATSESPSPSTILQPAITPEPPAIEAARPAARSAAAAPRPSVGVTLAVIAAVIVGLGFLVLLS